MKVLRINEFLDAQPPIEVIKHELIRQIEKDKRDYVNKTPGSINLYELGTIIGKVINDKSMTLSGKKEFLSGIRNSLKNN